MPEVMTRGKNQILFSYLPERTIDFKGLAIARITEIQGIKPSDVSQNTVLRRVAVEVQAWNEQNRPRLRDAILSDPGRFELIEPQEGHCELFPKVFWCQNRSCGRVFDYTRSNQLPPAMCPDCQGGQLVQLRFVRIHRCGNLEPLTPPPCRRCASGKKRMALDTRGSERVSSFRWICRNCGATQRINAGVCPHCSGNDRGMEIQVHRAGKTFYAYTTTLLNIPDRKLEALLTRDEFLWAPLIAAKFLQLPEVKDIRLIDLAKTILRQESSGGASVPTEDLARLTERFQSGELSAEEMVQELTRLRHQADQRNDLVDTTHLMTSIVERTGVQASVWVTSGYTLMESLLPKETASTVSMSSFSPGKPELELARSMGIADIELVSDFPIITATYGFSRSEYGPNNAHLNPFPSTQASGGKYPIFTDKVQADAIRVKLDHRIVLEWMESCGCPANLPRGSDDNLVRIGHFVELGTGTNILATIGSEQAELRLVFGLLHTLSHLAIRQAALLCGLERTSLSEYVLPCSLEFFLYSNHREGRTIGALTALFEQSLQSWLAEIMETRDCVYDPVCRNHGSACHACAHLAETSCRFFNLNLSRSFLFGGNDKVLGTIANGFLDFARRQRMGID